MNLPKTNQPMKQTVPRDKTLSPSPNLEILAAGSRARGEKPDVVRKHTDQFLPLVGIVVSQEATVCEHFGRVDLDAQFVRFVGRVLFSKGKKRG